MGSWTYYTIVALLAAGTEQVLHRYVLRSEKDALAYTAVFQTCAFLCISPFAVGALGEVEISRRVGAMLLASSALWTLYSYFTFRASQRADACLVALVSRTRIVILALAGWLIFRESIVPVQWIGILLIVAGASMSVFRGLPSRQLLGLRDAAASTLAISAALLVDKTLARTLPPSFIALFGFGFSGIWTIIALQKAATGRFTRLAKARWRVIVPTAAISATSYIALLMAMRLGTLAEVMALYQVSLLVTLVGSYLVLNERLDFKARSLGVFILVLGAAMVKWASPEAL